MNSPNLTTVPLPPAKRRSIGRNRADQALGLIPEDRTPRQNWGKFEAHKWRGFTGRLEATCTRTFGRAWNGPAFASRVPVSDSGRRALPAWTLVRSSERTDPRFGRNGGGDDNTTPIIGSRRRPSTSRARAARFVRARSHPTGYALALVAARPTRAARGRFRASGQHSNRRTSSWAI